MKFVEQIHCFKMISMWFQGDEVLNGNKAYIFQCSSLIVVINKYITHLDEFNEYNLSKSVNIASRE